MPFVLAARVHEDAACTRPALAGHQEGVERGVSFSFPGCQADLGLHGQRTFVSWGLFASGRSISTDRQMVAVWAQFAYHLKSQLRVHECFSPDREFLAVHSCRGKNPERVSDLPRVQRPEAAGPQLDHSGPQGDRRGTAANRSGTAGLLIPVPVVFRPEAGRTSAGVVARAGARKTGGVSVKVTFCPRTAACLPETTRRHPRCSAETQPVSVVGDGGAGTRPGEAGA